MNPFLVNAYTFKITRKNITHITNFQLVDLPIYEQACALQNASSLTKAYYYVGDSESTSTSINMKLEHRFIESSVSTRAIDKGLYVEGLEPEENCNLFWTLFDHTVEQISLKLLNP